MGNENYDKTDPRLAALDEAALRDGTMASWKWQAANIGHVEKLSPEELAATRKRSAEYRWPPAPPGVTYLSDPESMG
jgi:hypothetical protein